MMDDPAEFPQFIFYPDGYQHSVATSEARARMPPGWGHHPNGPFPGADLARIPWEPLHGPFAPEHQWHQYGGFFRGLGRLYACKWVIIDKHVYAEGEILPQPTTLEQERKRQAGDLAVVWADAQPVTHAPTGRVFIDHATCDAYGKSYKARDLAGIFPGILSPQGPALTSEASHGHISTQEPQRQRRKRLPIYDKETFEQEVRRVYFGYCDAQGEIPSKSYVASNLKTPLSVKTMDRYHLMWQLRYPPQP